MSQWTNFYELKDKNDKIKYYEHMLKKKNKKKNVMNQKTMKLAYVGLVLLFHLRVCMLYYSN